ncbi:MAG TPA: 2Fe-2S iron-sulfur cluster binding domain-containing protein [Noviherbaspirillum sp.]
MSDPTRRHACVVAPGEFRFEAPDGIPLLQAARNAGIDLPASCRNGTCRACICRLVDGKIGYRIAWPGLSAEEKRDGYILPCVALPESDVVLDVPRARLLTKG